MALHSVPATNRGLTVFETYDTIFDSLEK